MSRLQSVSFPFDEHYVSSAQENNKQLKAQPRALGTLYVQASANCFLVLQDNAAGPGAPGVDQTTRIYPVELAAPLNVGWFSMTWHGGIDFQNGIYLAAYTTLALAIAGGAPDAGNILWIEAYWRRGRFQAASVLSGANPPGYQP